MDTKTLVALVAVVAVALLGLLMRRGGARPGTPSVPPPDAGPEPDEGSYAELLEEDESAETAAITSDGWAFMPVGDRDRVQLVPPKQPREEVSAPSGNVTEHWHRGDLLAARIRRGAPDHDPWVLEGLGRDQEYRAWRFETEEAARAALDLVVRRVVRPPQSDDGPVQIGEAEFAAARRRDQEIEAELASMPEEEEPGGPRDPIR